MKMLKLTEKAKAYVEAQKETYKNPSIVVFEKSYKSWCGPRTYIGVQVLDDDELAGSDRLKNINEEHGEPNIYVDSAVERKMQFNYKIDISGFGPFQRLALVQD